MGRLYGRYFTWKADCRSAFGTVKVISKPQHGTISNHLIDWRIGISRRKGVPDQCFGRPIKALAVFYKPQPGYHGIDSFSLDLPGSRYLHDQRAVGWRTCANAYVAAIWLRNSALWRCR